VLLRRIACCEMQLGNHGAAADHLQLCLGIGERCLTPEHPMMRVTAVMLANAHVQSAQWDAALALYAAHLQAVIEAQGEGDPLVTGGMYGQAMCFQELGDLGAAKAAYLRCGNALQAAGQTEAAHTAMNSAVLCQDLHAQGCAKSIEAGNAVLPVVA